MSTLIIGGGLAGICAAEQLRKIDESFHVVQSSAMPSSTAAATGMYNPIVFKRLNLSWKVDVLIPELILFYESLETVLGVKLLDKHGLYKHIRNKEYEKFWNSRLNNPEYMPFMGAIEEALGEVKQTGTLDCALLQSTYLKKLKAESLLIDTSFYNKDLIRTGSQLSFKGRLYDRIIFCEGAFGAENQLFNWLPWKLCRGEWITIKTNKPVTKVVLNNRVNIIPLDENTYKLSSTFSWDDLDWNTTPQAVDELLLDFTEIFDASYEVIDQKAAIRPTVADRRPYLGAHPDDDRLFIFNGLGSKGVMLAPYFSKHLIDHIFQGEKLMHEVDIKRHHKRYYNQDEKS